MPMLVSFSRNFDEAELTVACPAWANTLSNCKQPSDQIRGEWG